METFTKKDKPMPYLPFSNPIRYPEFFSKWLSTQAANNNADQSLDNNLAWRDEKHGDTTHPNEYMPRFAPSFLIEGTDAVGKTTLARKLQHLFNSIYVHMTRPANNFHPYTDYLRVMDFYCAPPDLVTWKHTTPPTSSVIFDRLHPSEPAYAIARENPCKITVDQWHGLEQSRKARGICLALIVATESLLRGRLLQHGRDEMYSAEKIIKANAAFLAMTQHGDFAYCLRPDILIICDEDHPFPDEADALSIASAGLHMSMNRESLTL